MRSTVRELAKASWLLAFVAGCSDAVSPPEHRPSAQRSSPVNLEYAVRFRDSIGAADRAMTAEFTTHEPSYVFRGQPTMLVRLPEAAVAALRASPRVRSVSRGRPLELHAEQTGWHFAGYPQGHRLLALQDTAVGQGAQGTDGSDVGIAIIDSGVDCFNLNNVDMYQACAGGYNFTLDPGPYYDAVRDPSTGQVSHHGTSVASVINAIIKNSVGVRGAAPGALVYSLKIFSSVIGDYPDCNRSAAAIDYATFTLSAEVAIINLSYGSGQVRTRQGMQRIVRRKSMPFTQRG